MLMALRQVRTDFMNMLAFCLILKTIWDLSHFPYFDLFQFISWGKYDKQWSFSNSQCSILEHLIDLLHVIVLLELAINNLSTVIIYILYIPIYFQGHLTTSYMYVWFMIESLINDPFFFFHLFYFISGGTLILITKFFWVIVIPYCINIDEKWFRLSLLWGRSFE